MPKIKVTVTVDVTEKKLKEVGYTLDDFRSMLVIRSESDMREFLAGSAKIVKVKAE